MSLEIGTEAAKFPEKEYINGIFVAVRMNFERRGSILNAQCKGDFNAGRVEDYLQCRDEGDSLP
jgi:hypothetical protein